MSAPRCFKAALILFLMLSAYAQASAAGQWRFLSPSPAGNAIRDAWSPDNGATIYFVGDGGMILRKVGNTYTFMDSGTTSPLTGIHGTSATDIWAVGGSSMAETPAERSVILHYDGTAWTSRGMTTSNNPPELSSTYEVYSVYAADAAHVWAGGWGSAPWRWTGGSTWEQENVNIDYIAFPNTQYGNLKAVYGFSANDVYAVGSYGTVLHKDASGWSLERQFETELEGGTGNMTFNLLQDVWGPDSDHVFACGNAGQVYLLDKTLGSPAWTKINDGGFIFDAYDLSRMAGGGPNDVWFVGAAGVLRRWHGAGTPEGLDDFDMAGGYTARSSILRTTGSNYYLAGEKGTIDTLNADTQAVTQLNTPAQTSSSLRFAGWNGKLWLAPATSGETTGVYTWKNNKLTAHPIPGLVSGTVTAFAAFSATDVWVATSDMASASVKRYDGSTWNTWAPNGYYGQGISGVAKSPSGIYAVLYGRSWASGTGASGSGNPSIVGASDFYRLDPSSMENYFYNAIASDENGKFYAAGSRVEEIASNPGQYKVIGGRVVTGQGTSWDTPENLGDDELRGVAAGDGYVVVVGENRTAYYSHNGGAWTQVSGITRRPPPDAVYPAETFVSVVYAGNGVFYALCNSSPHWTDGDKGFIYRIEDGVGTLVDGGYSGQLYGLAAVPAVNGAFASGFSGSILTNLSQEYLDTLNKGAGLPWLMLLLQ